MLQSMDSDASIGFAFCVFFFKQKTAYEMRISDWSSDVCSSDLPDPLRITADPALVRAIGGALTVFATLMARKGIESLEETANLLGIYAVLTDEIAPDEALILGCWAGMLRDAAEGIS